MKITQHYTVDSLQLNTIHNSQCHYQSIKLSGYYLLPPHDNIIKKNKWMEGRKQAWLSLF